MSSAAAGVVTNDVYNEFREGLPSATPTHGSCDVFMRDAAERVRGVMEVMESSEPPDRAASSRRCLTQL